MKFICGFFRNHLAVSGMKVLTAPSEPFGPGQSDQADLYAGDGDQHVGTGGQGCSGGQYVIDQHDMLVCCRAGKALSDRANRSSALSHRS